MRSLLSQKIALVTGGAQGIGWATAQGLADQGAEVYVCDCSEKNLAQAAAELAKTPRKNQIHLAYCDVTRRPEVEAWITEIYKKTGAIDILVNNAAYVKWTDISEMSVEEAERTMQVAYNGMVYTIKAVLPLMLKARTGHIINMGSCTGRIFGGGVSAAYAAAKAAIEGYTQILQWELRNTDITITLVRPATVAGTDFFREHVSPNRLPRLADFIPYVTPPQIARAILQAIRCRRTVVDVPSYLPLFYMAFNTAPTLFRQLFSLGGGGRRNYGAVEWRWQ